MDTMRVLTKPTTNVRWVAITALSVMSLLLAVGCSGPTPQPKPSSTTVDWTAMDAAVETAIARGPAGLDNIRAVVVSVDGKIKLEHYRHGFNADSHEHVFSVTKSVVATLIGIAIDDGLIKSLDQPLSELLPEHRKAMTPTEARVTLRQLMSMTGGFTDSMSTELYRSMYTRDGDFIDYILSRGHLVDPGKAYLYSDVSAHLTVAVLASALKRSGRKGNRTVLEYARAKLFGPLGIQTEPAYTGQVAEPLPKAFGRADFGWLTDPDGLPFGGGGLRLTPTDMIKIGELYRANGVWDGVQLLPRG